MFKLATKHTFPWPVTVTMPDPAKAGAVVSHSFTATFQAVTSEEAARIDERIRQDHPDDYDAHAADYLLDVTLGWDDVVDENNDPVEFSRELLARHLGFGWFRKALADAYTEGMSGQAARLGN